MEIKMGKKNRNRGGAAPVTVAAAAEIDLGTAAAMVAALPFAVRTPPPPAEIRPIVNVTNAFFVADVANDVDRAIETMAAETMAAAYDPMAPVDGAPDLAAAVAASAAAIAAARTPTLPPPTPPPPPRHAPGVPDGLHPPGTWLDVPGLGICEIRGIHHRIEYRDRAPQWGNVSGTMWTPTDPTVRPVMVGVAPVYPIGTDGVSSRGRIGTIRETFYAVRDKTKTMHNVAHVRVSRTRPASGPYGLVYADVIAAPATPAPTVRAIDGTV